MKKYIPSVEETFCDGCGKKCDDISAKWGFYFWLSSWTFMPSGERLMPTTRKYDFCDDCGDIMRKAYKASFETLKAERQPKEAV